MMEQPPPALVATIRSALFGEPAPSFGEPWMAWLAIALCRQRARQDWLVEVAHERLNRDECSEGQVPGMPLWNFDFHGRGLCLTGPGNEVLDVDFYGGDQGPQTIDPYFFITRIALLKPKSAVERRLEFWFANERELLVEGLVHLRGLGVVTHATSMHVFRLHPWLEAHYEQIAAVDFDEVAVWNAWARLMGDDPDPEQNGFIRWALGLLQDRKRARIIEALAPRLPPDVASDACLQLLDGPVDHVTGRAVRVLRKQGRTPGTAAFTLLNRLDPLLHNPFSACEMAEWLFLHGMQKQGLALVHRFSAQRKITGFHGNPFDAEYGVLALRFAPDVALPLVRQALRSRTPNAVHRIAALLSVLDEPWCRSELLEAAADVEDRSNQRFIVGCLLHSADENTRIGAMGSLPPPPNFADGTVGYTSEEVAFLNLRESVVFQRVRARKVASLLRPN